MTQRFRQKREVRDGEVHGYFCGKAERLGFEARKTVSADSSRNFQRLRVGGVIETSATLEVCAEESNR